MYHRWPQGIRAHVLACFIALVLYTVMSMRLKAANRLESPTTVLEQLNCIHQQTAVTVDGKTPIGLTEITPVQKSLFDCLVGDLREILQGKPYQSGAERAVLL